jgi:hypothetical protein
MAKEFFRISKTILTESTIHGIPSFIRTDRLVLKLMWLFFFTASSGFCFYLIVRSINEYLMYDVVTQIRVLYEFPAVFPTVYICSKTPIANNNSIEFTKNFLDQIGIVDPFNTPVFSKFTLQDKMYFLNYFSLTHIQSQNKDVLRNLSLKYDEMFLSCYFNSVPCNEANFTWSYFEIYGACFIFNSNKNDLQKIYKDGPLNGLILELIVPKVVSPYSFATSKGINIYIANISNILSIPQGVNIKTGTETNIVVNREFTRKLEKPFSECIADLESTGSLFYKIITEMGTDYSQQKCVDLCFQTLLVKICACISSSSQIQLPGYPKCTNLSQISCAGTQYTSFYSTKSKDLNDCLLECPLECETSSYPLTLSMADYPTEAYAELLVNFTNISSYLSNQMEPLTYDTLRNQILKLNIFYDELKYTSIGETEKTSFIDLLAGIGGTLGLCIGMSFLSFIELVELLLEMAFIGFETYKCRVKQIKTSQK